MKKIVLATGLMLSLALFAADKYYWVGGTAGYETDFATASNWTFNSAPAANPPPYNSWAYVGAGGSVVVPGAAEMPSRVIADRLTIGYEAGSYATPAELSFGEGYLRLGTCHIGGASENLGGTKDSAGRVTIASGNELELAGEMIIGFADTTVTPRPRSYFTMTGGIAGGNYNFMVGGNGVAQLDLSGGELQNRNGWLSIGRFRTGEGYFNISGGTLKSQHSGGILLGEEGYGELNVSGTGLVEVTGEIRMGWRNTGSGVLNLNGGEIRTPGIVRYTGNDQGVSAIVSFNGGKLKMVGSDPNRLFLSNLTAVNMLAGGVTIEVPAGYRANVDTPIVDGTGDGTSGGLTKTGDGVLALAPGNTYDGSTVVSAGVLVLPSETAIDMQKLVLNGGSVVLDVTGWSAAALADYISSTSGALGLEVPAGETYTISTAIGSNVTSINKTGEGTLVLSGANAFTGDVRIYSGTVKADLGVGIPATAGIKMLGGAWAPASGDSVSLPLGTGAGALDASSGPLGIAAESSLAVDYGGDAHAIQVGGSELGSRRLFFNPAPFAGTVEVANPFTVGADFSITNASGTVSLAGGISGTGGNFWKYGAGTLLFKNGATFSMNGRDVNFDGGETVFDGGTHATGQILARYGGGIVLTNNAELAVNGQLLLAEKQAGASGSVKLYGSRLSVNNWFVVGRFDNSPGYFEMDSTSTLESTGGGNFVVGNKGDGIFVNNGGTISTTRPFGIGEWDNEGGRQLTGRFIMNGGSLTATSADSDIGHNGIGFFDLNDGTVEFKNLAIGLNNSATGTLSVAGGTLTVHEEAHLGNLGGASYYQSGGTATWESKVLFAHGNKSSTADFEISGGEFVSPNVISFGRNGRLEGRVTGGSVRQTTTGDMVFGRYSTGSAEMEITGGKLVYEPAGNATYIGQEGTGVVSVAGSGLFAASNTVRLAYAGTSVGRVNLGGDGVVEVKKFSIGSGSSSVTADGGTFRVIGDNATCDFFDGTLGESHVGPNGVAFDTGNNTVSIGDFANDGHSVGPLVKTGSGTLRVSTLLDLPNGYNVNAGTLALADNVAAGTPYAVIPECEEGNEFPADPSKTLLENNYLVHRWSFNSSWEDSISENTAYSDGTVPATLDDNGRTATIVGGGKGTSAISLGQNILPADGSPVTIEIWAHRNEVKTWSQMIDIGANNNNYLMMGWCQGDGSNQVFSVNNQFNESIGMFPNGQELHFALVVVSDGTGSEITGYQQDPVTGETIHKATRYVSNWTIESLNQQYAWLGRSMFGDADASATYDEVRVWNAALSEAQLSANAILGPDALPQLSSEYAAQFVTNRPTTIASGATLDIGGNTVAFADIEAAGTIASGESGLLSVTGSLKPTGEMAIDGNVKVTGDLLFTPGGRISLEGSLDLTEARLVLGDDVEVPVVLVSAPDGGIIGPVGEIDTGSRQLMVIVEPTVIRVSNRGLMMIVR